jgi:hypothetical protein
VTVRDLLELVNRSLVARDVGLDSEVIVSLLNDARATAEEYPTEGVVSRISHQGKPVARLHILATGD